ncbi:hypothetical protein [Devosia sp. 919]|uniref:hypothetical protein n=1 Tax=Devosia sp. 919 TaxID=2726065 RepID=UPI0015576282|nr:hypothetical protein [Devosia sp. 919]
MDWFEKLTGFPEAGYEETKDKLIVADRRLHSRVNDASYGVGEIELVSLGTLRTRAQLAGPPRGQLKASVVTGDVRAMHSDPLHADALFQVASQFNLLEMVGPDVTPEQGVTRYQFDRTQGPACAMAAGAATIFRNYFVPVGGSRGQTASRQIDAIQELGAVLSEAVGMQIDALWTMRNGYVLVTQPGLEAISGYLRTISTAELDKLRAKLCIGVHSDVEVTDVEGSKPQFVSQAFCSALPVAYNRVRGPHWEPFARLVLEAAYEATIWSGVLNARRGASNIVFLTFLGGGAFGNAEDWIDAAINRSLHLAARFDLDVRLVSYGKPSANKLKLVEKFK